MEQKPSELTHEQLPSPLPSERRGRQDDAVMEADRQEVRIASSSRGGARAEERKPAKPSEKDLMTGNCMTCDSKVRWPRTLLVFRCTVCLAINDLESARDAEPSRGSPLVSSLRNSGGHGAINAPNGIGDLNVVGGLS